MKQIADLIKESLKNINETSNSFINLDALYLYKVWSGDEDYDDWNLSKEDIDELRKHTWMTPSQGGYDGDGRSWLDCLIDGGVDKNWLTKVLKKWGINSIDDTYEYGVEDIDGIYSIFNLDMKPDACRACKDYVKDWEGDDMKVNPKCGIAYWNSGYDAPMIVLFDVPKTHPLVKALKKVEPFS